MTIKIRKPQISDGKEIWKLIKRTGNLDLNSEYCYFMLADLYQDQCAIVTSPDHAGILGFASCLPRQEEDNTLFVWQICTDPQLQKQGMAKKMLHFILENQQDKVKYIQATISEDNLGSRALFTSIAKSYDAKIDKDLYIDAQDFSNSHKSEFIYRIGILNY
ncbi:diaminobutyrate acetyltransferase [Reichenbachiella agarivorans]|uniref:L-2,4-diaminobutyric acid acetyltransferase n=1 Tax=Reichenbachiella agarivorans TaxID=2979464 RepID=A0ABY6CYQ3_9BACT|nr:diaminobutyrate acetyltransferase [Reichenbachiella agarivorans]UXP33360.1 diaminobutyrate acetyltransferase [Reichenbachiella agarivorans]